MPHGGHSGDLPWLSASDSLSELVLRDFLVAIYSIEDR